MRTLAVLVLAGCLLLQLACPSSGTAACLQSYSRAERMRAMIIVQRIAQALAGDPESHAALLPSGPQVIQSLELIRCDRESSPRSRSRHIRAIAKILSRDWLGMHSIPLLLQLDFTTPAQIAAFKIRVLKDFPPEAVSLNLHDEEWLEYAILRRMITKNDVPAPGPHAWDFFGPRAAYADRTPVCWKPEGESTNEYVGPFVKVTAHVSVDTGAADTSRNVDAQQWNDCGRFWSPPGGADGARFVTLPTGPCKRANESTLSPDDMAPAPGSTYPPPPHFLFEHYYLQTDQGEMWFKNVLPVWVFLSKRLTAKGTEVESQRLSFRLAGCGNDPVNGAIDGAIGKDDMEVVLDSGHIEVWTEDGRTHVASEKSAQLSDPAVNWLTQFNPALNELNDELGELACCLTD